MDNKRLIVAMMVGLVVLLAWGWGIQYLDKRHPEWNIAGRTPATQPVAEGAGPSGSQNAMPMAMSPSTQGGAGAATAPGQASVAGGDATQVVIGSTDPVSTYHMAVALTTKGAAVEGVTLNEFKKQIGSDERYVFQQPVEGDDALATRDVVVGSVRISTRDVNWKLESHDEVSAVFSCEVTAPSGEKLKVTKRYTLDPSAAQSVGYELALDMTVTNIGTLPAAVAMGMNGTIAPPYEIERGPERQVLHAYVDATRRQMLVRHTPLETFKKDNPTIDVTKDHDNPHQLAWFGVNGAYFNAIVRPIDAAGGPAAAWLRTVDAVWENTDATDTHLRDVVTRFNVATVDLAPGQNSLVTAKVYFGPKKRDVLKTDYYSAYPIAYDETLVMSSGLCGICTFQWLIGILVQMLNFFHFVVRDWGVSIILLVLVVRSLLHPITRKSQENMMKMGKMGPKIEEIKKRYADDKEGLNKAMVAVYKEQGAAPVLGCLPMFLQMPIWISLYSSLQSTFELRQAPFLYNLTWIKDLSKPDHLINFPTFTLFGLVPISGLNLIPFLLAIVFFLQQHFTPKPPATTEEQRMQQQMMKWMTLVFPVFLYSMPAGLTIYILTSTSFGIIESKIIRDKIKAMDAAQEKGTVSVIDLPASAKSGGKPRYNNGPAAPKKKGLMGWMEEMQAKVEEIKKQQEDKDKGK